MPVFDYQCPGCDAYAEDVFFKLDEKPDHIQCPVCQEHDLVQVPMIGAIHGDEAAWLQSVTEVVDPEGGVHCQRFRRDPTRENYKAWMKAEGLRPLESGERAVSRKSDKQKEEEKRKRISSFVKQHRKAKSITL